MFRYIRLLALPVLLLLPVLLNAQVLPKEGSNLNYRIIGFSFPPAKFPKGTNCKIEIASGGFDDTASFKKAVVHVQYLHANKVIIEVPAFGSQYTWRVAFSDKKYAGQRNILHHFSTAFAPNVDTTHLRCRILKHTYKYRDMYVFFERNRALYDMNGDPVWFLPKIDSSDNEFRSVLDLKLSSHNTITFISNNIYEVDWNGNILWEKDAHTSDSARPETFHHEFTRLANGHYMVLDNIIALYKNDSDLNPNTISDTKKEPVNVTFARVIEYDESGKEVWAWDASRYYKKIWLKHRNDTYNIYNDTHANAFFFDEKNKCIYISFRDVSQIVKIQYPSGQVLNVYGDPDAGDSTGKGYLFCMQHACSISPEGYLCVFNNNSCSPQLPDVVLMKESGPGKNILKKVMQYNCPDSVITRGIPKKDKRSTSGGNAIELSDHAMFISLCSPYANAAIIGRNKKTLWNAVAETRQNQEQKWEPVLQYRASIIKSKKELDKLIWSSELR